MAAVFIAGSIAGFLLQVVLPLKSQEHISAEQQAVQEKISAKSRQLERQLEQSRGKVAALDRSVDESRLLLDHFFGKGAKEQTAVVTYMRYQFPNDFRKESLQAILAAGARHEVKPVIVRSLASAGGVGQSGLNAAVRDESTGFARLASGDLVGAGQAFTAAYKAFPTYHNVDEIAHKVLSDNLTRGFAHTPPAERRARLKRALSDILTVYSWGIPRGMRPRLEAKLKSLG